MTNVDVVIEIPKGSNVKYEYDKERHMIICDRVLHTPMKYPFNYGFIPNTLSEDGDPLDVVILMDDELVPGCMIKCKVLGYLDTKDDAGNDPKLIVCPIKKVDPMWENIDDLFSAYEVSSQFNTHDKKFIMNDSENIQMPKLEINVHTLMRIKYFFEHYKDLENKKVSVGKFHNKNDALKVYEESIVRFTYSLIQKSKITDFFHRI